MPGAGGTAARLVEYRNIPAVIATIVSKRLATLHELQTVYGVRDAYLLLEVVTVDDYNQAVINAPE